MDEFDEQDMLKKKEESSETDDDENFTKLTIKEVLDKTGFGFGSQQFINILFMLIGAPFLLIGIINGLKVILGHLVYYLIETAGQIDHVLWRTDHFIWILISKIEKSIVNCHKDRIDTVRIFIDNTLQHSRPTEIEHTQKDSEGREKKNLLSIYGERLNTWAETGIDPGWPSDLSEQQRNLIEHLKDIEEADDATID